MDYLMGRKDIDNSKIIIYGRSLGGAVAIDLLSLPYFSDKAFAMIVENTFTSIPHMADQLLSGLDRLPIFCFRNQVSCSMLSFSNTASHSCWAVMLVVDQVNQE
jgi:hypothetical protein